MNLLSGVESKSFRTFTLFTFVVLITLALLVSIFSNKYRVSTINYDYELNLNYEGLKEIEKLSIWLVNDDNFEKFYLDNPNVENLEISKKFLEISQTFLEISKNFLEISKKFLHKILEFYLKFLVCVRNFWKHM